MDRYSIGKNLRQCRLAKKMRQEDLAEKTNLSPNYIGMIERGEKVPKLETFVRIANALEVSADRLLADVLRTQLCIDTSARAASINSLDKESRDRIYDVIDTLLRHEKKHK